MKEFEIKPHQKEVKDLSSYLENRNKYHVISIEEYKKLEEELKKAAKEIRTKEYDKISKEMIEKTNGFVQNYTPSEYEDELVDEFEVFDE
jgi:hypothetical protein